MEHFTSDNDWRTVICIDPSLTDRLNEDFREATQDIPHGREIPFTNADIAAFIDAIFIPHKDIKVVVDEIFVRRYFDNLVGNYDILDGETNDAGEKMLRTLKARIQIDAVHRSLFDYDYYHPGGKYIRERGYR